MPEAWVVITSRAGTHRKGEWTLCGHTLVEWVLEATKSWLPRVVVTTDQPEVMLVAHRYGARVVVRSEHLAQGEPGMQAKAVLHALDIVQAYKDDIVHLVQPTSPFINYLQLLMLEEKLRSGYKSAQTVHKVPHNYHEINQRAVCGERVSFCHREERMEQANKQAKEDRYAFGNVVSTTYRWLENTGDFFVGPSAYIKIGRLDSMDIDHYVDLQIAEALVLAGLIRHPFREDLTYA